MNRALIVASVLCLACDVTPAPRVERKQEAFIGQLCVTDAECAIFANPCDGPLRCVNNICIPPEVPLNCDDGLYCNGVEHCVDNVGCVPGDPPCSGTCEEVSDVCGCTNPDADDDGHPSLGCGGDDCDDQDPLRHPGLSEVCDVDGKDEDCDCSTLGERDGDSDGYLDGRCCNRAGDVANCGDDCNDAAPGIHPHLPDICDGLDNDCDGTADDDGLDTELLCPDTDGDGYGAGERERVCRGMAGYSQLCNDCMDTNPSVYPGIQICDGEERVRYCSPDGKIRSASCDLGGTAVGAFCFPQPNGTGVCIKAGRAR